MPSRVLPPLIRTAGQELIGGRQRQKKIHQVLAGSLTGSVAAVQAIVILMLYLWGCPENVIQDSPFILSLPGSLPDSGRFFEKLPEKSHKKHENPNNIISI